MEVTLRTPSPEAAFVGIVIGLGVTRLLTGLANYVQHPSSTKIYPVHLGWVVYLLLVLVHFWWFQFGLSRVEDWSFEHYVFVFLYAALLFFSCAILFPEFLDDYSRFGDYLYSRRRWFFGLMATIVVADVIDTALKGADYFAALGVAYPIRQIVLFSAFVTAMFVSTVRFNAVIVILALVFQITWVVWRYTDLL